MIILRNVETLDRPTAQDVAVEGTLIVAAGPHAAAGAEEIIFDQAIAFPGLINSHDHLEFGNYEQLDGGPYSDYVEWAESIWRRHAARIAELESVPRAQRVLLGIAKNLLSGVTSVAHHGPAPGCVNAPIRIIEGTRPIHSPRLEGIRGLLVPDRRPVVVHIGEGTSSESAREIDTFVHRNVWRKKLIAVHAIAMRPEQAARFAAVIWCPVSNEFLYGRSAAIALLKRNVAVLFGTDSPMTASWNIWEHLRRAREIGGLTDAELIASVSTAAAGVWSLSNLGVIAPGAIADIVVARKRCGDRTEAFFAINPEDILLVMANGRIVLIDASLKAQWAGRTPLFPVIVNGVEKLTAVDYHEVLQFAGGNAVHP